MKQQTLAPACYPARFPCNNPNDWNDPGYNPREYNNPVLTTEPIPKWADPEENDLRVMESRITYSGPTDGNVGRETTLRDHGVYNSSRTKFLNPKGKTGIVGRGLLGKWGPNHAADVIVTRDAIDGNGFEVLLVTKHTGDGVSCLAFPAGMVEAGHDVPATLYKELTEEAVRDSKQVQRLFNECKLGVVYRGFVDDYRNTDHAWMETTAAHFHADDSVDLELCVSDTNEIAKVAWYKIDDVHTMYASHIDWLGYAASTLLQRKEAKKRVADFDAETATAMFPTAKRKRMADKIIKLPGNRLKDILHAIAKRNEAAITWMDSYISNDTGLIVGKLSESPDTFEFDIQKLGDATLSEIETILARSSEATEAPVGIA